MAGDRPRQPAHQCFSSRLNVDFNSLNLGLWVQKVERTRHEFWISFKDARFLPLFINLARKTVTDIRLVAYDHKHC